MKFKDFIKQNNTKRNYINNLITRIFLTSITVLLVLIISKNNTTFKSFIQKNLLDTNYNFSKINSIYKKYILNLKDKSTISKVNKEESFIYKSKKDYKDGVLLEVDENYNVKLLESGLVVYVGEKDGLRQCVIVQQTNGIDIIYGFINNVDIKVYDYVEKGTIIGSASKELYIAFQKEGEFVSYEPYIK